MNYTIHGILQARILEWVAYPFSRGSPQPRDLTQVSRIAGRFFTSWATREAQDYGSGKPISTPGDLPDPGIEPGSLALQVNSSPPELSADMIKHLHLDILTGVLWYLIMDLIFIPLLLLLCPTLQPHRRQPTRLLHPWDSPGKNTGVCCHFLLHSFL